MSNAKVAQIMLEVVSVRTIPSSSTPTGAGVTQQIVEAVIVPTDTQAKIAHSMIEAVIIPTATPGTPPKRKTYMIS